MMGWLMIIMIVIIYRYDHHLMGIYSLINDAWLMIIQGYSTQYIGDHHSESILISHFTGMTRLF